MAGVFREIEITWKGKAYTVRPSSAILRRIEQSGGLSIPSVMASLSRGEPPGYVMAFILWKLLLAAGAEATEDEVAQALLAPGKDGDAAAQQLSEVLVLSITPVTAGNVEAAAGQK